MYKIVYVFLCLLMTLPVLACSQQYYDNKTDYTELINITHSKESIEEFYYLNGVSKITLKDLRKMFIVECVRKTFDGYYVVLKVEDGSWEYIFLDEEQVTDSITITERRKSEEFTVLETGKTLLSEALKMMGTGIPMHPLAKKERWFYYVEEGVVILTYDRFTDHLLRDPILESIEILKEEQWLEAYGKTISSYDIPYILPIDRR